MAYSINPNLVNARKTALLLVFKDKLPVGVVARKCGVNRTTIWRWTRKWKKLNENISQVHYGRPSRQTRFCVDYYRWTVNTLSSAPNTHPKRLPEWIERRVVELRLAINRCAAIIQEYLSQENIKISLSSIKRILKRHHLLRDKSKWKKYHRTLKRPMVSSPGDLVEVDTVHYTNNRSRKRKYIITVIDLHTRLAYAKCFTRLIPSNSLTAMLEAEKYFGFKFKTVQTDNGPEFGSWLSRQLETRYIIHRHTRVHRPNDNAHIERFNRTLRDESIGQNMSSDLTVNDISKRLRNFIDYYNNDRLHLGIECKTPASIALKAGYGMLQR